MGALRAYLDNAATTAVDPEVLETMLPFFGEKYANPSGASSFSAIARNAVNKAREQVAELIGAEADEIIFTSGGTESDNMAVFGSTWISRGTEPGELLSPAFGSKMRIITSRIEHPAVLNPCRELENEGFDVIYAPCDTNGLTDNGFIKNNLTGNTALVSIMLVNNELGTIQNIEELADAVHREGAYLHTDAVQAAGHIPVDVNRLGVDLLSISSHKIHGPKGVGALYVRRGTRLKATVYGGGQENGLRSGTLNVPGIAGFGKACELAKKELSQVTGRMIGQKNMFADLLNSGTDGVHINTPAMSVPSILSVSFDGIEGSSLLIELDMKGICCSTGSACSASSTKPSHVLKAAGLSEERIKGSIRFSFSKFTTDEELRYAAGITAECVKRLRALCL